MFHLSQHRDRENQGNAGGENIPYWLGVNKSVDSITNRVVEQVVLSFIGLFPIKFKAFGMYVHCLKCFLLRLVSFIFGKNDDPASC
jgi:hypothetical protein